ncbi:hypothetical protein ACQKMD_21095, partial [Viridibacillus sp. NPDC096237]
KKDALIIARLLKDGRFSYPRLLKNVEAELRISSTLHVNPVAKDRYMIFNYITKEFEGELLEDAPEGKAVWGDIEKAYKLPMQTSIRRRFPLFFKDGTFEIQLNGTTKKIKKGKLLYVTHIFLFN